MKILSRKFGFVRFSVLHKHFLPRQFGAIRYIELPKYRIVQNGGGGKP